MDIFILLCYNQVRYYYVCKGTCNMNERVYNAVISGTSDYNIKYTDFANLILDLGFELRRKRGSHTMYYHRGINAFMNIQKDGSKAKAYQVEQLRDIIKDNNL